MILFDFLFMIIFTIIRITVALVMVAITACLVLAGGTIVFYTLKEILWTCS